MIYEQPSLEQQNTTGNLELVLEQRVFVGGWDVLAVGCIFLSFVSILFTGIIGVVAFMAIFIAIMVLLGGALSFRRPAVLTLSPVSLRVRAWTGWPARPQETTFALDQATVRHTVSVQINHRCLYQLIVSDSAQEKKIQGLACTTEELKQIVALVEQRRDHASALVGDGAAEVPEALRKFLAAVPEGG